KQHSFPRCFPRAPIPSLLKVVSLAPLPVLIPMMTGVGICTIQSRALTISVIRMPLNTCAVWGLKRYSSLNIWGCLFPERKKDVSIKDLSVASQRILVKVGRQRELAQQLTEPVMPCY